MSNIICDIIGRKWTQYKPGFWAPVSAILETDRIMALRAASDEYRRKFFPEQQKS